MPKVNVINNIDNSNDEISLNNGDLILILRDGEIINHLLVSSYKDGKMDIYKRTKFCNLIQFRSGLSYKSNPLGRKTNRAKIKKYLFGDFQRDNFFTFKVIKGNAYSISIKVEEA